MEKQILWLAVFLISYVTSEKEENDPNITISLNQSDVTMLSVASYISN